MPKTWRREPTSKCSDTDNRGSDNREPTVLQIGMDFLEEEITAFKEYVQSVDVVAFNKLKGS